MRTFCTSAFPKRLATEYENEGERGVVGVEGVAVEGSAAVDGGGGSGVDDGVTGSGTEAEWGGAL